MSKERIFLLSKQKSEEKRQCSSKLQACGEYCGPPQATCYSGQCSHRPRHSFSPDGSPKRQKNACTKKKMKLKKKIAVMFTQEKKLEKIKLLFTCWVPPWGPHRVHDRPAVISWGRRSADHLVGRRRTVHVRGTSRHSWTCWARTWGTSVAWREAGRDWTSLALDRDTDLIRHLVG